MRIHLPSGVQHMSGIPIVADVTWVDTMKSKHERLDTNALLLASRSGFTPEARDVAKKYGIELFTSVSYSGAVYTVGSAVSSSPLAILQPLGASNRTLLGLDR